ncbi:MAG: leucyl/phenylalanyl-tRNA--protein transferase [Parerythrobacter sp.]
MHAPAFPPIAIETLLLAYRSGIFPMADGRDDPEVFWVEPRERAVVPLDGFRVSKSLRKVLRQDRFRVTIDTAFTDVVSLCAAPRADHPESWISWRIAASYRALHEAGHAHSVECWCTDEHGREVLAGGLYGVAFDRVFCGESMFSRADNASKVALAWLVAMLRRADYALLDCQFMTDHLASLGAIEIPQALYLERLAASRGVPDATLPQAYASLLSEAAGAASSSPGKRIAQSLIQTS